MASQYWYCLTTSENISASTGPLKDFPYSINNNLNGSFSFVASINFVKAPYIYLTRVNGEYNDGLWFVLVDSSPYGQNKTIYTYKIHWPRTIASAIHYDSNIKLFWDRNGIFTDDLLNYEDIELKEGVRSAFNLQRHTFSSYTYPNGGGTPVVYQLLDHNRYSPSIYAVFALNANDSNFSSMPLSLKIYGQDNLKTNPFTSLLFVPIMQLPTFNLGSLNYNNVKNTVQDVYNMQNDVNFAKKFLGYYKAPTAFSLEDAGNYFANYFDSEANISYKGLRYCKMNLKSKGTIPFIGFQMVMTSYINNFFIPFSAPFLTSYEYSPTQSVNTTTLEHLHLTQVFDYKIGATSAPYTKLLSDFGLTKTYWNNLTTYAFKVPQVNMGFADGVIIQSQHNSDAKIYYGSTLPYLYDGYVDWNIQNRTALNAKVHTGLSGIIGGILGAPFAGIKPSPTNSGEGSGNEVINGFQRFTYNVSQVIKGAPTYSQQIKQAQISNPANLVTNADVSGCYSDLQYYFYANGNNPVYGKRAITYEISSYNNDVIKYANEWLREYGFGGVPRYMNSSRTPTYYSGYVRLSQNSANVSILRRYIYNYLTTKLGSYLKAFIIAPIDDITNEVYEWMCGGYYQ